MLEHESEKHLIKCKKFLEKLCEARKEKPFIWFDTSQPYDNEVCIRLEGHRCWNCCASFRFENKKLRAYDSYFGGGTTFLDFDIDEEKKIREIMEKVFNKECSNSGWENDKGEHREIKIGDDFWIVDKYKEEIRKKIRKECEEGKGMKQMTLIELQGGVKQ